jgi:thioredoxin reductase (NADPH)
MARLPSRQYNDSVSASKSPSSTGTDVIVVGGGPAGLAAGIHLSRAGYRTLLVEKGQFGGQAGRIDWIENYPGFPAGIKGADLMALWLAQARRWGLKCLRAQVSGLVRQSSFFRIILPNGRRLRCRAVLCCAGAEFKRLGLSGEDGFLGRYVHHAAFDEAPRFRNKVVAVVGAGEAALHQALLLAKFARRVHLLSRGPTIKAHRLLKSRMTRRPNLIHSPNMTVEKIDGHRRLERIVVRDRVSGLHKSLDVSGLFVLIGKQKSTFPSGKAKGPGYFVAGDASGDICRQVVVAAGSGVQAAMECIRYLEGWSNPHENS